MSLQSTPCGRPGRACGTWRDLQAAGRLLPGRGLLAPFKAYPGPCELARPVSEPSWPWEATRKAPRPDLAQALGCTVVKTIKGHTLARLRKSPLAAYRLGAQGTQVSVKMRSTRFIAHQ